MKLNITPKQPIGEQSRLRDFEREHVRAKLGIQRCQEMLVVDTARRLKARWKAHTRFNEPTQSDLASWLVSCGRYEMTYSDRIGYKTRHFYGEKLLEVASSITLGNDERLNWFSDALEVQLGGIVKVTISGQMGVPFGKDAPKTIYFSLPVEP